MLWEYNANSNYDHLCPIWMPIFPYFVKFNVWTSNCTIGKIKICIIKVWLILNIEDICTLVLSGSGYPPGGTPRYPWKYSITDTGKDNSSARSSTISLVSLFWTINWAISPTTLEEGVTYKLYHLSSNVHVSWWLSKDSYNTKIH